MKKRSLLVSGVVILLLLSMWFKFRTTDTFVLLFHPEEYFAVEEIDTVPEVFSDSTDSTDSTDSLQSQGDLNFEVEANEYQIDESEILEEENKEELLPAEIVADYSTFYAYSHMQENLKPLYVKIYEILSARETDIVIPTKIEDEISIAFICVIQDHPELFFVDGYVYSIYRYGDEIDSIVFGGKYSMDESSILSSQQQIDAYVTQFLQGITQDMDTYEKVKAAYEAIILNTTYNIYAKDNQNANSVFIYRESVCQGYAEAFQYLLYSMDIPCMIVTGTADGEPHAFNLVEIDNAYYYVDTTWGEGQEFANSDGNLAQEINYNYLNITTEEILKTHTIDSPVALPYCTETKDNYYVREGTYLNVLDTAQLANMFNTAYTLGKNEITIKCENAYIYQDLISHMFTNEHIFDYIQKKNDRVRYLSNDATNTITVYL